MNISFSDRRRIVWLIKRTCYDFDTTKRLIFSKTRKQEVVYAKKVIWYNLYKHAKLSKSKIGYIFNKVGHDTVIYAIKTYKNLIDTYPMFRRMAFEIEKDFCNEFQSKITNMPLKRKLSSRIFNIPGCASWEQIGKLINR